MTHIHHYSITQNNLTALKVLSTLPVYPSLPLTPSNTDLGLHQFSWVAQSCPTLCKPMNRSRPGLPVHHQLPEFTQTHIHCVSDAIQPSHPLSSPSPPAPILIVLPFPECHIVGIIQYVAFSVWFLSVSDANLKSFHVFSWLNSLFLFSCWVTKHSLEVPQFIYSFTYWRTPWLLPGWGRYE